MLRDWHQSTRFQTTTGELSDDRLPFLFLGRIVASAQISRSEEIAVSKIMRVTR